MKWKKGISIFLSILAIVCVLSVIYLKVFNIKVFNLQSSSMEPSIQEGSMLLNEMSDFKDIKVGDVITYKSKSLDLYITHRVQEIRPKTKQIICKGDANKVIDESFVDYESQYNGTLILCVPFAGKVLTFLHGGWGQFLSILIIVILISAIGYDLYQRNVK